MLILFTHQSVQTLENLAFSYAIVIVYSMPQFVFMAPTVFL